LDGALVDLDSARYALAYLVEVGVEDSSRPVIECVINTLSDVAQEAKAGWDVASEELKAKMGIDRA
jgi:hypothetical protein